MEVLSYTEARSRLKELMERVSADRTHVVLTRQKAEPVVMVSLSEWNSIEETMHLLTSRANAERLHEAIRELDAGQGIGRNLIET